MLPEADQYAETYFDTMNKQTSAHARTRVARAGALAAQYTAQQIERERTRRAIERVAEERRALKALSGESHDTQQRASTDEC